MRPTERGCGPPSRPSRRQPMLVWEAATRLVVVFADADGMTKAGSSYDGPWRVAPARSASPRPPMPPTGREVAVAQSAPAGAPPMQPPMGREVAVHNSAPVRRRGCGEGGARAAARAAAARLAPRADAEAERARACTMN